jgi:hypothetical protein
MQFIDESDVIPVVVTMEAIYKIHIVSSVLFLLPVIRLNQKTEIDLKRYNKDFLKENIFL